MLSANYLQAEQRSRTKEVEKGKLNFRRKRSLQTAPPILTGTAASVPKRSRIVETMRRLQRFIEMHRFVERYVRRVNDQNAKFILSKKGK
jgi:membrane carboxypeptidase/penicillin-binding protein PbpC